ncbi:MAG: sulfotransferase domain-containing protein [Bacteroidales bacterium]|nr:sulfotransferase domain-containing protein [Bacteroidales bacterium]
MFILSAGMPKSGSTLFSLYQKSILERTLKNNGQKAFEQLILDGKINGIGIFVHDLESPEILKKLVDLSLEIGPFVVKSHLNLSNDLITCLKRKEILATYIHRDPRDVILSAIDHGNRAVDHPNANTFFRQFASVQNSIPIVKDFCRAGIDWIRSGLCETYSYQDLLTKPESVMIRFNDFIHTKLDAAIFRELIDTYSRNAIIGKKQFNTGKLLRFPDEMSPADVETCIREMAEELKLLGYLP